MTGRIVGSEIREMHVTKGEVLERPLSIKNDIKLVSIDKKKLTSGIKEDEGLFFKFDFSTKYGDKSGSIDIQGVVLYMDEKKELDKMVESWRKEKKLDDKIMVSVLNRALELSYMKALALAESCRLPMPMQMPRFAAKPVEEGKKKK
jgi:hypothetical protein